MSTEFFHRFLARVLIIYPCIAKKTCMILPLHFKKKIFFFRLLLLLIPFSMVIFIFHINVARFFLNVQEVNQEENLTF